MNRVFLAIIVGLSIFVFASTSFAATYRCEGTVRTLVAMSSRQIWTNVPVALKPLSAPSLEVAQKDAASIAKSEVERRETTVSVAYAKMSCVEVPPEKPKGDPKPLDSIVPVRIEYKWRCRVKTTWHLGTKSGTIEKDGIEVSTEREDAEGEALGKAILLVQERAKSLLFGKKDRPTWTATDAKCTH